MQIAVYPGSFNPLHTGHLAIMECLSANPSFDCTYMVVSPWNPLKGADGGLNAQDRLDAARSAVERHPELKVRVDDIEFGMEPPYYTIRTLDALRAREPGNGFTLVMGADNLCDIRRWRDWGRILEDYGVAVYPRLRYDAASAREGLLAENGKFRITLLDAPRVDISSSEIRRAEAQGLDMSEYRI